MNVVEKSTSTSEHNQSTLDKLNKMTREVKNEEFNINTYATICLFSLL